MHDDRVTNRNVEPVDSRVVTLIFEPFDLWAQHMLLRQALFERSVAILHDRKYRKSTHAQQWHLEHEPKFRTERATGKAVVFQMQI